LKLFGIRFKYPFKYNIIGITEIIDYMRLYILYEIIVLGVYIIYKLGQHPGGDAGRLRARQLDLEEAIAPSFRSSLGGGILILLHIMGGIAIVQSPDGVH